jgi:3-deoxy-manno-octulosonate cytidylyltransferase (CMP-KDO synthetase)
MKYPLVEHEKENRAEEDRCLEEIRQTIKARRNLKKDVAAIIIEPISAFENQETKIATLSNKSISQEDLINPNRIKIVADVNNFALYFSRSSIPNSANFKGNPILSYPFLRHIGLYAYRRETLLQLIELEPTILEQIESLEQLRWLFYGYKIKLVETTIETPNIDVPEDVQKVLPFL